MFIFYGWMAFQKLKFIVLLTIFKNMYFEYQISSSERFCMIAFNNIFTYDVYKDYEFPLIKSKYKTSNHFVSM